MKTFNSLYRTPVYKKFKEDIKEWYFPKENGEQLYLKRRFSWKEQFPYLFLYVLLLTFVFVCAALLWVFLPIFSLAPLVLFGWIFPWLIQNSYCDLVIDLRNLQLIIIHSDPVGRFFLKDVIMELEDIGKFVSESSSAKSTLPVITQGLPYKKINFSHTIVLSLQGAKEIISHNPVNVSNNRPAIALNSLFDLIREWDRLEDWKDEYGLTMK